MKAPLRTLGVLFFSLTLSTSITAAVVKDAQFGKINLNSADVLQLTHAVKGIGSKRAEAIVDYRTSHGRFKALGDLALVKGLGAGFVKKHRGELEQVFVLE